MRERRREKEEENPGKCRKMDEKVDDCEGKKKLDYYYYYYYYYY